VTAGRALARGGLIVSGAFFVSRILGWFRIVVFGWTFDTQQLGPFYQAFRIPDLIFQLVAAGALSSALIPTIAHLLADGEDARAWRVVSAVTNLMLIALAVLAGALFVFAGFLVPAVIAPGFSAADQTRTVDLTRLMLLSPIMLSLGSVATSVLNARGRFTASVLAPIFYNVAIILGSILLGPSMGLTGLAIGVVAGSACHLAIQLRPLFGTGFRYSPTLDRDDPETTRTLMLLAPRALGLGGAQIQLLAAGSIATGLGVSATTWFNMAFTIFQVPIGVIGVPLGVVTLPALSARIAAGATGEFASLVGRSLRLMLFVMIPLAILGMLASLQVSQLLYEHGKYGPADITHISAILMVFLVALPSETLIILLARAFYAMRDTRTPVGAALMAVVISIVVSLATCPFVGPPGLALGIAVASWAEALLLCVLLQRRVPAMRMRTLIGPAILNLVCGAFAGLALWEVLEVASSLFGSSPGTIVVAVELAVAGAIGVGIYLAFAWLMRIPEGPTIVRLVRTALRRGSPA
jgi:putative peptidoglycan lipid II flippase